MKASAKLRRKLKGKFIKALMVTLALEQAQEKKYGPRNNFKKRSGGNSGGR